MDIKLPPYVSTALQVLNSNGYQAYIVGGCVRDFLMGRTPHDFDITTNALPEEIMKVFSGYKVIPTGLKHGTVTVLTEGEPLEITTYRIDGDYSDNRRPDSISFTRNLKEDLARRDFTVNALAFSPDEGIVDYFCGQQDLQNKLIRCVGDANKRFSEDALRILRALRFASQLNFQIESATRQALFNNKGLLKNISMERIHDELLKLLMGQKARPILAEYIDIFEDLFPELLAMKGFDQNTPYHIYDVLIHTLYVVEYVPNVPCLKLAALLHDVGKPLTYTVDEKGIGHFYGHGTESVRLAEGILTRLKVDKQTKERVLILIKHHNDTINPDEKSVKRWLNRLGTEVFWDLIELKKADDLAHNPRFESRTKLLGQVTEIARKILDAGECITLKDLKINGNDLLDLGFAPNKELGNTLNKLLYMVMDERVPNQRESLLAAAKALRNK